MLRWGGRPHLVVGLLVVAVIVSAATVRFLWQPGDEHGGGRSRNSPPATLDRLASEVKCGAAAVSRQRARRPRPPDAAASDVTEDYTPNAMQLFNDYGRPESVYATRNVVVHYVTSGVNAPPLNDDDENGVPDYVQRTAGAAEQAIRYFRGRGFTPIRPDTGGTNELPDVYISRFTPGYFGVALPATRAEGGAFVVVANWLDPSPTRSLGSLHGTVAHELFHLVQFSYFSTGADLALPDWVQEGTAGGIERRANPNLDDVLWDIQARDWLATPSRSIASFPYAAELFWHYADRTNSRLLPEFVAALAHGKTGALSALQTVCGRVGVKSVAHLFHDFAVTTYNEQGKLSPTGWLAAPRASVIVKPLALQYLRLPVPVGLGYHLTVTLSTPSDSRYVTLAYRARPETAGEWPQMVKVKPIRQTAHAVTWRLRPSSTLEDPSLLLTASGVSRATTFEFRITKVDRPH